MECRPGAQQLAVVSRSPGAGARPGHSGGRRHADGALGAAFRVRAPPRFPAVAPGAVSRPRYREYRNGRRQSMRTALSGRGVRLRDLGRRARAGGHGGSRRRRLGSPRAGVRGVPAGTPTGRLPVPWRRGGRMAWASGRRRSDPLSARPDRAPVCRRDSARGVAASCVRMDRPGRSWRRSTAC